MTLDRRNFMSGAGVAGLAGLMTAVPRKAEAERRPLPTEALLVASWDAPQAVRDSAAYVCTASNDQAVINRALRELGNAGGTIRLSRGRFHLAGPILMQSRTALVGDGRATVLKAWGGWRSRDGTRQGAVIEPANAGVDTTTVSSLKIDGNRYQNRADVGGIYYNITNNTGFWVKPDAEHHLTDLLIVGTRHHGVHIAGAEMRGNILSHIRVFDAGNATTENNSNVAHGLLIESPDTSVDVCESGSASGFGFYVNGTSNRFTNCKSWYSDLSGWRIRQPRCAFSACESQDNAEHGFYITTGPVSLVACHADSNSWDSSAPRRGYHGFYIKWGERIQLLGCSAYDKNERYRGSPRGRWQTYGAWLGSAAKHCQVIMTAQDNWRGPVGGAGATDNSNIVMVSG